MFLFGLARRFQGMPASPSRAEGRSPDPGCSRFRAASIRCQDRKPPLPFPAGTPCTVRRTGSVGFHIWELVEVYRHRTAIAIQIRHCSIERRISRRLRASCPAYLYPFFPLPALPTSASIEVQYRSSAANFEPRRPLRGIFTSAPVHPSQAEGARNFHGIQRLGQNIIRTEVQGFRPEVLVRQP